MKEEEVKVSVYMPKELKKQFHQQVISEGKTMSALIVELVTDYLENANKEKGAF